MLAGIKSSLGVEPEKKSVFGATGDKLKAAGSKLAAGEIPTFQDESAFAKCCPNLSMKQVCLLQFYLVQMTFTSFLIIIYSSISLRSDDWPIMASHRNFLL